MRIWEIPPWGFQMECDCRIRAISQPIWIRQRKNTKKSTKKKFLFLIYVHRSIKMTMWSRIRFIIFNSLKIIGFRFIPSFWASFTLELYICSFCFYFRTLLVAEIEHQTYRRWLTAVASMSFFFSLILEWFLIGEFDFMPESCVF